VLTVAWLELMGRLCVCFTQDLPRRRRSCNECNQALPADFFKCAEH
jgi:hypothetical protein